MTDWTLYPPAARPPTQYKSTMDIPPFPNSVPMIASDSPNSYPSDSLAHPADLEPSYLREPRQDFWMDFVRPEAFDQPFNNSVEIPPNFAQRDPSLFASDMNPWSSNPPFGAQGPFENAFTTGLPFGAIGTEAFESSCGSPNTSSPAPSIMEDQSPHSQPLSSPALTNNSLKRESPAPEEEPAPKRVQRKRGRPRMHHPESDSTFDSGDSPKNRPSRRLPHNQVERKYREGLNAELERLRRAVPTLPQRDSTDLTGPPKPSKATVLASAIDYIKYIEGERDRLRDENERLRGMQPSSFRPVSKCKSYGWNKTRCDSVVGS